MGIGAPELIMIFLVILLLFGAKKIPELARGLGQGINEFRKASTEIQKEIEKGAEDVEKASSLKKEETDLSKSQSKSKKEPN